MTLTPKKRIFILGDGQGWIVDRGVDEMIRHLAPRFEFVRRSFSQVRTEELIDLANSADLTHYGNWDFSRHLGSEAKILRPVLMSVRSFRYPAYTNDLAKRFHLHVVNPQLLERFPNAHYIPNGIFDGFCPDHEFTVGMVFQKVSAEYKGHALVKAACDKLGIRLVVVNEFDVVPEKMPDFYRSVDLVVVASENEGANTIAMECLAMNRPVLTTDVGMPRLLNCHKVERSVEALEQAIGRFYTAPQVAKFRYAAICEQFADLYERLAASPSPQNLSL